MTREELAARIFAAYCSDGTATSRSTAKYAFDQANVFLAYAADQREKAKTQDHDCDGYKCQHISHYPERCNHNWCSINGGPTHCLHCGAPKVNPEPTKPERGARQVWVSFYKDSEKPLAVWDTKFQEDCRLFREVIES